MASAPGGKYLRTLTSRLRLIYGPVVTLWYHPEKATLNLFGCRWKNVSLRVSTQERTYLSSEPKAGL